jgi:hypothetical protein
MRNGWVLPGTANLEVRNVSRSLVNAINAIENAEDGSDISGLVEYCAGNGLDAEQVKRLVDMPGPTDLGRVTQALNNPDLGKEEVVEDGEASEQADNEADSGAETEGGNTGSDDVQ